MDRAQLDRAAQVIADGGIVAYPTESCYGLGCDPRRHAAVKRLLQIKRRKWQQGLILIGAQLKHFHRYTDLASELMEQPQSTWPGPYTWVLPAWPRVSLWLRGRHDGIALRVTAHPGAAALCQHIGGALVSTSANRHGRPPARSAAAVDREFAGHIDYILPGRLGGAKAPSQIQDARTGTVLRG